mgnify:CR=1 FL=1
MTFLFCRKTQKKNFFSSAPQLGRLLVEFHGQEDLPEDQVRQDQRIAVQLQEEDYEEQRAISMYV